MPHEVQEFMYPVMSRLICDCGTEMQKDHNTALEACFKAAHDGSTAQILYKCPNCNAEYITDEWFPMTKYITGTPLSALGLSWRSYREMITHGLYTVEKVVEEIDKLNLPMIIVAEVKRTLKDRGIKDGMQGDKRNTITD